MKVVPRITKEITLLKKIRTLLTGIAVRLKSSRQWKHLRKINQVSQVLVIIKYKIDQKQDSTKQYIPPETKREGEPVFLVIQTGAYASTHNLSKAVKELTDIGVYPRIIGDELFYIYTATDSSDDSAQKMVVC